MPDKPPDRALPLPQALRALARAVAGRLDLPLGWEGETFIPPLCPHLRGRVELDGARAAACGQGAPAREDGVLRLDVVTVAGQGDALAQSLARRVAACAPRGTSLVCAGGEAVFATPQVGTPATEGGRVRCTCSCPFYAITMEVRS